VNPVKTRNKLFRLFLLVFVYSSLNLGAPIYVDCQDLLPDEWLDLLGIPSPSRFSALKTNPSLHGESSALSDFLGNRCNSKKNRSRAFCWLLLA
jgi:hypothetical protein